MLHARRAIHDFHSNTNSAICRAVDQTPLAMAAGLWSSRGDGSFVTAR
jgi:hypothetical protein